MTDKAVGELWRSGCGICCCKGAVRELIRKLVEERKFTYLAQDPRLECVEPPGYPVELLETEAEQKALHDYGIDPATWEE